MPLSLRIGVVPDMPDLNEFISTEEAAEKLKYHVEHVRRMMREGSIEGDQDRPDLAGQAHCAGWVHEAHRQHGQARSHAGTSNKTPPKGRFCFTPPIILICQFLEG